MKKLLSCSVVVVLLLVQSIGPVCAVGEVDQCLAPQSLYRDIFSAPISDTEMARINEEADGAGAFEAVLDSDEFEEGDGEFVPDEDLGIKAVAAAVRVEKKNGKTTSFIVEDISSAYRYTVAGSVTDTSMPHATVYQAVDSEGSSVRLCVFLLEEEKGLAMFRKMVTLLSRLNYPGIPRIRKVFHVPLQDGIPARGCIVMDDHRLESIAGKTIFSLVELMKWIHKCYDAGLMLRYLHSQRVYHGGVGMETLFWDPVTGQSYLNHFDTLGTISSDKKETVGKDVDDLLRMFSMLCEQALAKISLASLVQPIVSPLLKKAKRQIQGKARRYTSVEGFLNDLHQTLCALQDAVSDLSADKVGDIGDFFFPKNKPDTYRCQDSVDGRFALLNKTTRERFDWVVLQDMKQRASGNGAGESCRGGFAANRALHAYRDQEVLLKREGFLSFKLSGQDSSEQRVSWNSRNALLDFLHRMREVSMLKWLNGAGAPRLCETYVSRTDKMPPSSDGLTMKAGSIGLVKEVEWIHGTSLSAYLDKRKRVGWRELLGIVRKTALAVSVVHDQGVVHRDLKPENIVITTRGEVRIADFGTAVLGVGKTLTHVIEGTPYYMSPEQVMSQSCDASTDVYNMAAWILKLLLTTYVDENMLGICTYDPAMEEQFKKMTGLDPGKLDDVRRQCFVGAVVGEPQLALLEQRLRKTDKYQKNREFRLLMKRLTKVLRKALRRNPKRRYQTAREFAQAIDWALFAKRKNLPDVFYPREDIKIPYGAVGVLLPPTEGAVGREDASGIYKLISPARYVAYEQFLKKYHSFAAGMPTVQNIKDLLFRLDTIYIEPEEIPSSMTLREYLAQSTDPPLQQRLELLRQLASTLAECKRNGFELRDDLWNCIDDIRVVDGANIVISFRAFALPEFSFFLGDIFGGLRKGVRFCAKMFRRSFVQYDYSLRKVVATMLFVEIAGEDVGSFKGQCLQEVRKWISQKNLTAQGYSQLANILSFYQVLHTSYDVPTGAIEAHSVVAFRDISQGLDAATESGCHYDIEKELVPDRLFLARMQEGSFAENGLMLRSDFFQNGVAEGLTGVAAARVARRKKAYLLERGDGAMGLEWLEECKNLYETDRGYVVSMNGSSPGRALHEYMRDRKLPLVERLGKLHRVLQMVERNYENEIYFQRPDPHLIRIHPPTQEPPSLAGELHADEERISWFAIDSLVIDTPLPLEDCLWDSPSSIWEFVTTELVGSDEQDLLVLFGKINPLFLKGRHSFAGLMVLLEHLVGDYTRVQTTKTKKKKAESSLFNWWGKKSKEEAQQPSESSDASDTMSLQVKIKKALSKKTLRVAGREFSLGGVLKIFKGGKAKPKDKKGPGRRWRGFGLWGASKQLAKCA